MHNGKDDQPDPTNMPLKIKAKRPSQSSGGDGGDSSVQISPSPTPPSLFQDHRIEPEREQQRYGNAHLKSVSFAKHGRPQA